MRHKWNEGASVQNFNLPYSLLNLLVAQSPQAPTFSSVKYLVCLKYAFAFAQKYTCLGRAEPLSLSFTSEHDQDL